MTDIVDRLWDLHKQATTESSHYYTAKVAQEAVEEIERLRWFLRGILDNEEYDAHRIAKVALGLVGTKSEPSS